MGTGGLNKDNVAAQRRSLYGAGFFLTGTIFTLTVLGSFGIFGYTQITQKSIDAKTHKIELAREKLSPKVIAGYERLDLKLQEAKNLVESHVALSELLLTLEEITLKNVQYTEMSYGNSKSSKGKSMRPTASNSALGVPVAVSGVATSLATVALQLDQYQIHEFLHDANIDLLERNEKIDKTTEKTTETKEEKTGEMKFSVTFFADPQITSFSRAFNRAPVTNSVNTPASVIPPVTTGSSTASATREGGDTLNTTP